MRFVERVWEAYFVKGNLPKKGGFRGVSLPSHVDVKGLLLDAYAGKVFLSTSFLNRIFVSLYRNTNHMTLLTPNFEWRLLKSASRPGVVVVEL